MVQEKRGRWLALLRKEPVLCIAAVCAAVSTLLNPPSPAYLNYIDWRVLTLLFCLMAVVAGLQECGVFAVLAQRLLAGERRMRLVSLALVLLPFFVSMVVTNDVALITFVPFAVLVLGLIGRTEYLAPLVVLQTMAANLGSMATPVGNPQNLYLYADYELTAEQFFGTMLPLTLVSLAVLTAASLLCVRDEGIQVRFQEQAELRRPGRLGLMAGLFVLCLLSVFRVLPYPALLAVVAGGLSAL
ncbi:MAG: SLC13 family permease [Flavonifractor plautii]